MGFLASALATPLDTQITAFEQAQTQSEGAVANVLKMGLAEHRAAEAYAAVRMWLAEHPSSSQAVLYDAGRSAQYAGEWPEAVSYYRKLLKSRSLDARLAGEVVPATYRLLINNMRDPEAAYLFMREDGNRLRQYGRAKQFDRRFLEQARERGDLPAIAGRLAAVYNTPADDPGLYADSMTSLLQAIETFAHGSDELSEAMEKLAVAAKAPRELKARWNWIKEVVRFSPEAAEFIHSRKDTPRELFEKPVQAAQALVAVQPYEGSKLVASGWVQFRHGDTPTFMRYVHAQGEFKMAPIKTALARLSAQQRSDLLASEIRGPRGRALTIGSLLPATIMREAAVKTPAAFNSLRAPNASLFDATLTVAEAKALAPQLARSPHAHAALVRAYAVAGTNTLSAMVPVMMKSERWRFTDSKSVVETVYRAPGIQRDADYNTLVKQHEKLGERYDQIKKQIAKEANTQNRTAAFNALYKELLGPTPATPGLLSLWDELFANAPDPDKVQVLKTMTANLRGEREYLLRRALAKCAFGGGGKIFWQAVVYDNHFRYHQKGTRQHAGELLEHLTGMVDAQAKAGTLSETIFGMWLHGIDVRDGRMRELMQAIVKSPAYAKIDPAYHRAAVDRHHFGHIAMPAAMAAIDPHHVSRELLEVPEDAAPSQVEAAFRTVMMRVSQAREPVAVYGLRKVAALPALSGPTRTLALSLFKDLSPLGDYPPRQGYEQLAVRLVKDMQQAGEWGAIEPYAADLWRSCDASDDMRHSRVGDALLALAEAAMEAGAPSVALSIARTGLKSGVSGLNPDDRHNPDAAKQRRARVGQVAGKAGLAIGMFEIPVDETAPAYGLYKSNAEYVQGNLDAAWSLYDANAELLLARDEGDAAAPPLLRKLPVAYGFWLLTRNLEEDRLERADALVKELLIWSRQQEGTFSLEQEAELRIALGDLAFRKGKLQVARATYRKVADAREYKGSEVYLRAALGSVKVDRVASEFAGALDELDKLMRLKDPAFRVRVHYARAEVLMAQENYKEAADSIEAVLRSEPNHADALILRSKIQYEMRRLVEASLVELGVSQAHKVIVPGEIVKIDLRDPTLSVSGIGADIEVEIWANSGDKERVMLHQLGDSKEKFRADVPTALGPPVAGDKTLQILGKDEIRFGYSKRFRDRMEDLPPDPKIVIGVASDAHMALSAGAFPPREGERRLDIEELGLSSAQRKLGTRMVRPGNPVYLRVTDPDQSTTPEADPVAVTLSTSSGDVIRRLQLKETGPYTGEFEAVVPTMGAQAIAFASESAPGRDPNMAISAKNYPGWLGKVGDKEKARTFGVDLNDNVALERMAIEWNGGGGALTHFVLQTSLNGRDWTTRARYPDNPAPWDGRPRVSSFPTYRGGISVSTPEGRSVPADWQEKMERTSVRASCNFLAATVTNLSGATLPVVNAGHPNYGVLLQVRALFYQPVVAVRRFRLAGWPATDEKGNVQTLFLIDGEPAAEDCDDPLLIEHELKPGLHEIQVWRHTAYHVQVKGKPGLMCDVPGRKELVPCHDSMFDPSAFPEGVRALISQPATITNALAGGLEIVFGGNTQARLVRLSIHGFEGVAPTVKRVTLTDRGGKAVLPVAEDFMALRQNTQLEVLPGDQITARYEDPVSATPKRTKHERRLGVAFNTAAITASFLNYETTTAGRRLVLEPIRRFRFEDAVAIVIDDVDMDGGPEKDVVDFEVTSSEGQTVTMKAVETEEHSGRFIGRVFPVASKPSRGSEIQLPKGGTLTATYRDMENLDPGIPADRAVTIQHAKYATPVLGAYTVTSEEIHALASTAARAVGRRKTRKLGPEVVVPRRTLNYTYTDSADLAETPLKGILGASVRFDVVVPHLALAGSSEIAAYVHTCAQASQAGAQAGAQAEAGQAFDINLPGTLKLNGGLRGGGTIGVPSGYTFGKTQGPASNEQPLEAGRFSFSVPLVLGNKPSRSYATKAAESLSPSVIPDGLAVRAGDVVRVGYAYKDENEQLQWKTTSFTVDGHAFLDVMNSSYNEPLPRAFVGEKVYIRLLARGLDKGPERDTTRVALATSGVETQYQLRETEAHTGVFKGVFTLSYADEVQPARLPPVELNGFPVRYGADVTIGYGASPEMPAQSCTVKVNKGADGVIEPFSKRFTGDEMAVKTGFTMAECFFELAKKHRKMDQESLARREMKHARKLLAEAIATHRDDELRAHAEYLLGNLAQEYADLSKNDDDKLPMYQDALKRFSKIPTDYPDTEFAPKAQFKTGLVYEKMGEVENSVEEYVKLAYKYPDNELIPSVMSRLGAYFQKLGQACKAQADPLREEEDDESKGEVLRLDELSYPHFLNAAMVFSKLQERFPDDPLAGLAGLRAAQNYMRAHQYEEAVDGFKVVVDAEEYDGRAVRAQALYWSGLSYERWAGTMTEGNWRGRGGCMDEAYKIYRRVTFDFPDSKWAKFARGRLSDKVFERKIELENKMRERVLEQLKYEQKKR